MKPSNKYAVHIIIMIFAVIVLFSKIFAQSEEAPPNVTAALILK